MGLDFEQTIAQPRPIGLTLFRASEIYGAEPFYHELIAGIDRVVRPHGLSVLLRVLPTREEELVQLGRWQREGIVSAVLLVDLIDDDERVAFVERSGIPAIVIGSPATAQQLPAIWTNDAVTMREAIDHLVAHGHRRLAHVTGPSELTHTESRVAAFASSTDLPEIDAVSLAGDYSRTSGFDAMQSLLAREERPTAVVFDSDVMALGGLQAAQEAGLRVPDDLSIVAWDDSAQCQLSDPPMSALSHDVQRIGEMAGSELLELLAGRPGSTREAPGAVFIERSTSGSAPLS